MPPHADWFGRWTDKRDTRSVKVQNYLVHYRFTFPFHWAFFTVLNFSVDNRYLGFIKIIKFIIFIKHYY